MASVSRVALFTKEYPPHIYGGAGVHVEYLARALARHLQVDIRCFGDQSATAPNLSVQGYPAWPQAAANPDPRFTGAIDALTRSLAIARDPQPAQLVHCHTWYTDMAGLFARLLWNLPYVLTIHSLEPLRPWKAEQLGQAWQLSAWMERTAIEAADAVIAVSRETREDVLRLFRVDPARVHVIHNGIDPEEYRPVPPTDVAQRHGIDPSRPFVLFVGRITRQKGIIHLIHALPRIDPAFQVVLCAGAPDTPEISAETEAGIAAAAAARPGIVWIRAMLPRAEIIELYGQAAIFCCPSIYEPFGLINLEAMACETAVVASAVGGIPEVVVPGETGLLVDPHLSPAGTPADPAAFAQGLADAINQLAQAPERRTQMGRNGRQRVLTHFSWDAIATQTIALYNDVLAAR